MKKTNSLLSNAISAETILSIGTINFIQEISNAIGHYITFDHVSLFAFDYHMTPHFVAGYSHGNQVTSRISRLYEQSMYYRNDPHSRLIGRKSLQSGEVLIQQLHAKDIKHQEYRKEIYEDNHLLDRVSLIDHENQKWFMLNFYRNINKKYFSLEDLNYLQQDSMMITALVKRHLSISPVIDWQTRTVPPISELENLITSLGGELSHREIEVCARVMQGMTREGVSLALNLKPPTVATYMTRAYSKLNISSLNELFALCLTKSFKK